MWSWEKGPTVFLFGLLLVVLGWAGRTLMAANNARHKKHDDHEKDASLHQTAEERRLLLELMTAHGKAQKELTDQRFTSVEAAIKDIATDVKQLLKRRQSGARRTK